MGESTEELEPLFDYSRVQPFNRVWLDDDSPDSSPPPSSKRKKLSGTEEKKEDKNGKVVEIVDCDGEEDDDWLPPPPKVQIDDQKFNEDSTIKELRLKKEELASLAKSAEDVIREVEESMKRDSITSIQPDIEIASDQSSRPLCERAKIVISFQEKEGVNLFRVYKDEKFERLFKMYADKSKLNLQKLVFCFDGDKISPAATPEGLGMEDDDIIEVHVKSS
ncbi:hypothetical protein NMG60_11018894 [Bertholletia excelsa]